MNFAIKKVTQDNRQQASDKMHLFLTQKKHIKQYVFRY